MLAKSFFNDTYKMSYSNGTQVNINEKGIAWSADIYYRYNNIKDLPSGKTWQSIQWLNMEDGKLVSLS